MDTVVGKKPREYVIIQSRYSGEDGKNYIIFKSHDYPPINADSVRGNVSIGAYVFAPSLTSDGSKETLFTHILHQDPRGQTMPVIVNLTQEFAMQSARRIEKVLGIAPPPPENWWKLLWKGRGAWATL